MVESVRILETGLCNPNASAMDFRSSVAAGRGLSEVGGESAKMEISDGPESRIMWDSSSVTMGCL